MPMNQSTRSKIIIVVCLLAVVSAVVIGIRWNSEDRHEASSQPGTENSATVRGQGNKNEGAGNRYTLVTPAGFSSDDIPGKSIDLSETSWHNPFAKEYWSTLRTATKKQMPLWSFDKESMWCESQQTVGATFRRAYRKLSLDLQLERPEPTGAFGIRLTAQGSETVLFAEFTDAQVEVYAEEPMKKRAVLKRSNLNPALSTEKSVPLRFAATGNRIIISHNNRRVLTCDQPAGLSGRNMQVTLLSRGSSCRITRLRIDGE